MAEQDPPIVPSSGGLAPDAPFIERYGIHPVLFGFISLFVVFVAYEVIGGTVTYLLFGITPTSGNIAGYRILTGSAELLLLLLPALFLVRFATFSPREYMRVRTPAIGAVLVPIVGIFSLQQMLQVYLVFQERIPLPAEAQHFLDQFKEMFEEAYRVLVSSNSWGEFLVVTLIVGVIPALSEEFLFRGLVQRSLEKGLGPLPGMVLTGILFAVYHLNPFSFVPLVVLGIYLGFLAQRSGSIWVSVAAHFTNNAMACLAAFLHFDDETVIAGKIETLSSGWLLAVFWFFGIIFLLSTLYFVQITRPPADAGPEPGSAPGAGEASA